ncbi:AI-2E family transporter [Ramlibacter sp.]|uniref:AI-2E family transporter n=1 Tax=Ramlibacter sp. TaxID=1917967 RepID=UPI002CCC2DC0|nr:AI-2E family transporter [Ramlibacter sp.]HWI83020.1 AI-2E family transporter [Ramlibacter sp.]
MSAHELDPDPGAPAGRLARRSVGVTALVLLGLLWLHLLPALVGALTGFVLFRAVAGDQPPRSWRDTVRTTVLTLVLLAVVSVALFQAFELLVSASSGGLPKLLQLLADTLDHIRTMAPGWIVDRLPDSAAALQQALSDWLRAHAGEMQRWGRDALRVLFHLVIGLAIGMLAAASLRAEPRAVLPRLAQARWRQLGLAFSDIVAAQLRIALVNTALTGAFLVVLLPLLGYQVPLARTLVAVTFFAGLLPIIGNLLSNTAIVLAALTVSPWVGIGSLAFLIGIHKLEYFLNAHFVGSRISMPAYALLVTMLVLESAFGAAGLIAAPIYCAWLTRELRQARWI